MNPNDIPTEITRLVYDDPVHRGPRAISQNDIARVLAHYWPAIQKHIREQIAQEIDAAADRCFAEYPHEQNMVSRGIGQRAAARIARGEQQ